MSEREQAWQYLISVLFSKQKEVPVELIKDFKLLATKHKVKLYCDFLRNIKLPKHVLNQPWENLFLEDLSPKLPKEIQILVLKGAAARDMDLYPIPNLRESEDLDLYVPNLDNYQKQEEFILFLQNELAMKSLGNWKNKLKRFKSVVLDHNNKLIDLHFELFLLPDNMPKFTTKSYYKKLQEKIIKRSIPYLFLGNIKKMNMEDFWFYCIYHFLSNFPKITLNSLLDAYLILSNLKDSEPILKNYAKDTDQLHLYTNGLYIISQLTKEYQKPKTNFLTKTIYNTSLISEQHYYSYKKKIFSCLSKACLISKNNFFLFFTASTFYLLYTFIQAFYTNSIEDKIISSTSISNLITKILHLNSRLRGNIKKILLKLAATCSNEKSVAPNIMSTDKQLMTIEIQGLRITFEVPEEFYKPLTMFWKGYLTNNHLNKKIKIEKVIEGYAPPDYKIIYSKGQVYIKLSDSVHGRADLKGTGTLFARNIWDIRTFASCLFRAMTLEKEDMILVHGGAVKINNEAFIFPGGTGAGKTTLFNILTKFGASPINDDTVFLRKDHDTWQIYPTPFMSKNEEPVICEKSKLTGIIDPIIVLGGHSISPISTDLGTALLFNNSISDFTIDDSCYVSSLVAKKIVDLSKQIKYSAQISFSTDNPETLFDLLIKWLSNPTKTYQHGETLTRLIELRGNSMEPTLKEGDILCVKEINSQDMRPKDIICFVIDPDDFPVVHRVLYILKHKEQITVITKGDNNIYEDRPYVFKPEQKILKVIKKI